MKIQRTIKGKVYDFELTMEEMSQAVDEFANASYTNFMRTQIEEMHDSDDCVLLKKLNEAELEEAINEMLPRFKELLEEYGYDEFDAWYQVSHKYIAQHR